MEARISKFVINGGKLLKGAIDISGAKNAAMKMIAASILTQEEVRLENVPKILDVIKLAEILQKMGAKIEFQNHTLKIDTTNLRSEEPDPELVGAMRASVVLIGPLLARFGKVNFSHPGGDKIGSRPIDRHIQAFRDLGVEVTEDNHGYTFRQGRGTGTKTRFDKITWTGTENLLLFAAGRNQTTTIDNIALEPEVFNLIDLLEKMGAKIQATGRTAVITGSSQLSGATAKCIGDRLEAATFAIMAAIAGEGITLNHIEPAHLEALWEKFREIGIKFEKKDDSVYIERPSKLRPTTISTAEYPGFITDSQPPMGLLLTQAEGESYIRENIFENRLGYLKELQKMGARIEILDNHQAKIFGPTKLAGADLQSLDLRAGATLLIAGLIANGQTSIEGAENIDRGYENIEERLSILGADIKRVA